MATQGSIPTSYLQNAITLGASSFEEPGVYQMNCICGQNMNDYYHAWPIITPVSHFTKVVIYKKKKMFDGVSIWGVDIMAVIPRLLTKEKAKI